LRSAKIRTSFAYSALRAIRHIVAMRAPTATSAVVCAAMRKDAEP
jgi:hypothetical protein